MFGPLLAMDNNIAVSCLRWNPSSVIGKTKKNEKLNMTSKSLQLSQLHACISHKFQPQLTKKLIIFIYYLDTQLKIYIPLDQLYNINNKIRVS